MKKNEKAKTRNIIVWAIIYFIAIFINQFEQNIEKKLGEQAASNAIRFIEDKYGFTPEITGIHSKLRNNDDYRLIDMTYEDKMFSVRADVSNENTVCFDSYQYDEIRENILNTIYSKDINAIIPNAEVGWHHSCGSEDDNYLDYLNDKYYDGNNIDEFMGNNLYIKLSILAYGGYESDFADLSDAIRDLSGNLDLICFDTKEHMEEFAEKYITQYNDIYYYPKGYQLKYYAPHITEMLRVNAGTVVFSGNPFSFKETDEFIYCRYESKDNDYDFPSTALHDEFITENTEYADVFEKAYENHITQFTIGQPLSNSYRYENREDETWIYLPANKFSEEQLENIVLIFTDIGGQSKASFYDEIERPKICGDYAVFRFHQPMSRVYFIMFADIPDETEN